MKLEMETTVEAVSMGNRTLVVRTAHASVLNEDFTHANEHFIRCVEFGALQEQTQQLFVGRKVKITIELLPHTEP